MPVRLVAHGVLTWAIEAVALAVLTRVLPGMHVVDVQIGLVAILVIGALNAILRPILVLYAVDLGFVIFALVALASNAVMVLLASVLVPGFAVDSLWTAAQLAFGLALLNTLISGQLGVSEDDSFYRNVVRWLERRRLPMAEVDEPGTILIQIDGLAEPILRLAIEQNGVPTLARWLASGSHRLEAWECDVPSMTSSGQSGILYGNNANIPAFRWYEKSSSRLLVSNHPSDAWFIEQRQATADGLLREHGSSIGNIFAGGAERCVVTMSRLTSGSGRLRASVQDLYDYFINPYNLSRAFGAMLLELVIECWEAARQRLLHVQPRMRRGGSYPLLRAVTCVLLRDITTWMLLADMFSGRRVAYADYLGYDEVAHHAGPATSDARRVLRKLDGQLRVLESAARKAPRQYRFVVLSDHGQSTGSTFRQRYGLTLDQLVRGLMDPGADVQLASGSGEAPGQVHALISDAGSAAGAVGAGARSLSQHVTLGRPDDVDQATRARARVEQAEVVVCASGNLGHVYFTRLPGRLSEEAIERAYPGLLAGLAEHPGIGFLLVHSEQGGGPVVFNRKGRRELKSDRVIGDDPLAGFSLHTAAFLRRLSSFSNVGDIVLNSMCDPDTKEVAAFEELIGCHGGAGGAQTTPFLLYPSEWGAPPPLVGAEQIHGFLAMHV
jgi:uncharacterized membrane protein YvlD (DUF360 family)